VNIYYLLKEEDLKQCVSFAINMYHKNNVNRVTGEIRGLGKIMDDWVSGKAIEIGVKNILENHGRTGKKLELDFDVYEKGETADKPDIKNVIENQTRRHPNLYIEIKNFNDRERWVGLREEQYNTIINFSGNISDIIEKTYLIFAELKKDRNNDDKRLDLLGAFLQKSTKEEYNSLFRDFVSLGNIIIQIKFIIPLSELKKNGYWFIPKEDYIYETDLFKNVKNHPKNLNKIEIHDNKLPVLQYGKINYPSKIGYFEISGDIEMYEKQNKNSKSYFIKALENSTIRNKFFGEYKLEKGKFYQFKFGPAGRNPEVHKKALWIPSRVAYMNYGKYSYIKEKLEEIMNGI
jgi:hypothetical protein